MPSLRLVVCTPQRCSEVASPLTETLWWDMWCSHVQLALLAWGGPMVWTSRAVAGSDVTAAQRMPAPRVLPLKPRKAYPSYLQPVPGMGKGTGAN